MKKVLMVVLSVIMLMTYARAAEVEIKSDKGIGKVLSTKIDDSTVQIDVTIHLMDGKTALEYEYVTMAVYGPGKPAFPHYERQINNKAYYSYYIEQVRTGKNGYADLSFTIPVTGDETCYLYFSGKKVTEAFELVVLLPPPDSQVITPMPRPDTSGSSGGGGGGGATVVFMPSVPTDETSDVENADVENTDTDISFSDIDNSHWAYNDCIKLLKLGIISGYEDGTLKPSAYVSREEIAAVLTRAFNISAENADFEMDNTSSEWAREYIAAAVENGIMLKNDEGSYRGKANATRAEVVTMINRCIKLDAGSEFIAGFADNSQIPDYSVSGFSALIEKGIVNGYEDNTLRPNNNISRAELFKIISRILEEDLV